MSFVGMITSSQVLKCQVDNYLAMDVLGVYTDDRATCKPNAVMWAKWTILFVSNIFTDVHHYCLSGHVNMWHIFLMGVIFHRIWLCVWNSEWQILA
jgi:hypothetical protein